MSSETSATRPTSHRRPRWFVALVAVIVIAVLLAVAVILIAGGKHGPGRHGAQQDRPGTQAG